MELRLMRKLKQGDFKDNVRHCSTKGGTFKPAYYGMEKIMDVSECTTRMVIAKLGTFRKAKRIVMVRCGIHGEECNSEHDQKHGRGRFYFLTTG